MYYLGVDIGGTKTAVGIINENNQLLNVESIPTDVQGGLKIISSNVAHLVSKVLNKQGLSYTDIDYIGVGCPGSIDIDGNVLYANNLNFLNAPLKDELLKHIPVPVFVENDANCAGLGEYYMLREKHIENFMMITLGTGIGSASIIEGKLFKGFNNAAPELGHCIIEAGGIQCDCGNKGCWEMYCAGHALVRDAREVAKKNPNSIMWDIANGSIDEIDGTVPFKAASEDDLAASEVIDRYLYYFRIGITNVINSFQPQILAIGGGISEQGDLIIQAAQDAVYKGSYSKNVNMTKVISARLGNKAGIYGAAFLKKRIT